jgi:hypothetical protein
MFIFINKILPDIFVYILEFTTLDFCAAPLHKTSEFHRYMYSK